MARTAWRPAKRSMWVGSLLPSGASGRTTSTSSASLARIASRFSRSRAAMRASVVLVLATTASGSGARAPCPPAGKLYPPRTNATSNGTAEERAKVRVHDAAPGTLERTTPRDELVDEDDGGDDEEQVNQSPTHVNDEKPSQPQDDQNDDQSPEHGNLLGLTADADGLLAASMGPTGRLCNGRDHARSRNQERQPPRWFVPPIL